MSDAEIIGATVVVGMILFAVRTIYIALRGNG